MAVVLAIIVLIALSIWTARSMSSETPTGQRTIVFWDAERLGPDIYAVVNQFEHLPENLDPKTGKPIYKVLMGSTASRGVTDDPQRLLCAVVGEVPPDVVWFDRFAIGEWAGMGALENLKPYLDHQSKDNPYRVDLNEYYQWAVNETSYRPPGTHKAYGVYGIPLDVDLRLLFSNTDILRQEGLVDPKTGEPQPPTTWAQLRKDANLLTRYNKPGDKSSGIKRLGFAPNVGNAYLYLYSWEAGGHMINADRTRITMDSPPNIRALRYMTHIYDDLGGFAQVDAFGQTFQSGPLDPFLLGNVAMETTGIWQLDSIANWKRNMDFMVSPPPMPADQLAAGAKPVTWGGGFSLAMPSTARDKQGAWKLIQYLCSDPIIEQLELGRRERAQSQGQLYMPNKGSANRVVFEHLVNKYVFGNPNVPKTFQDVYKVVLQMMPHTLYRPVTAVGQLLWNQQNDATQLALHHVYRDRAEKAMASKIAAGKATQSDVENYEMHLTLADAQKPVQEHLDELLKPAPKSTRVDWNPWFIVYGLLCVFPFVAMYFFYRWRKHKHAYKAREVWLAMLFASPWLIGFIVFIGGPIFFSILFAFT
ncbi:MAG TPA: extracellular solute-binding protein, partial [Tepidisphaeraceae bacterium]|nr:extracellular solute-binding protein [Tepidisphaeraceae bacterium]